jgi:HIV Tat-specific factor 1
VRVFASHPQGIVTVRFKQEEPAQACLSRMNGRFFGGHQIVAHMWDGFTSYHVSSMLQFLQPYGAL